MNDWVTAGIVAILAAAPLSVLLLALADVLPQPASGRWRRALKLGMLVAAVPLSIVLGLEVWSASGAAHLKPLCQAYGQPVYRSAKPVPADALRLDVTRSQSRSSRWFVIGQEHYRLVDERTGAEVATANEFWIDAGRRRHYCGVASGPRPVSSAARMRKDSMIAQFVQRASRGAAGEPRRKPGVAQAL